MKLFHCAHCQHLVFFENSRCLNCGHPLAYLPHLGVCSIEPIEDDLWVTPTQLEQNGKYRLCQNYERENVCNWAMPADDPNPFCESCRLTRIIPDLNQPGNREAWYRMEVAKRRLIYSLLDFGLPLKNKADDMLNGLAFEFLADSDVRVLTGHEDGLIVINIAEANDAVREKRRLQMHEPYRTLLGHFRHEIGHYYWDRLIRDSARLDAYRALFGDDREDYNQALQRHYQNGAPPDWPRRFVSAYASSHPWEDWAETWAHYLHMSDTLETAAGCGISLQFDQPYSSIGNANIKISPPGSFDLMIEQWFPMTTVLNNLNRSLGLADGYPFVLPAPVIEKLRFVHETIHGH